jgi:hypothetical protein
MKSPIRSLHPMRLIHRQQSYIAVAVAIYAALWAADRPCLVAGARTYAGKSTSELKSGLLSDVNRFGASQFRDDATLIVISALRSSRNNPRPDVEVCAAV